MSKKLIALAMALSFGFSVASFTVQASDAKTEAKEPVKKEEPKKEESKKEVKK